MEEPSNKPVVTDSSTATEKQTQKTSVPATTHILQWLTYAFWGFTLVALSVLIFIVMFNLLNDSNSENASLYTLAAIVVLLPISLVCDFLYQKREQPKKSGAGTAILAIHAVIFALIAIGMLITGLFAIIGLVTEVQSTYASNAATAIIVSSFIIFTLFGFTFIRTINPSKKTTLIPRVHAAVMGAIIVTFAVLAFVGPFALSLKTKDDRFIDNNISTLNDAIGDYARENHKLPNSLNDLSLPSQDTQRLVDEKLVTYHTDPSTPLMLRYQLCTTYKAADNTSSSYYRATPTNTYESYVSTYGHPAGDVCYKLQIINAAQPAAKPLDDISE